MAEILVKPPELRATAAQLRKTANIIQTAVYTVDSTLKQLGSSSFEEVGVESLNIRYDRIRSAVFRFKPLIDTFANDLDDAASRFSAADNAGA